MADTSESKQTVTKQEVLDWYSKGRTYDGAACKSAEKSRFDGEIAQIMKQLHPDVTERFVCKQGGKSRHPRTDIYRYSLSF